MKHSYMGMFGPVYDEPCLTVAQLMEFLSKVPPTSKVVFSNQFFYNIGSGEEVDICVVDARDNTVRLITCEPGV